MAEFTPVTKGSTNVKEDLRLAAGDRKLSLDEVDFDLLSYETYYKRGSDQEWRVVPSGDVYAQITQEDLYSEEYLLSQEYQIKIRPSVPILYLDLRFSVGISKAKGILTAIIDPTSAIPLKKGVQEWIKTVINKKKLRLGYLIGTDDEQLDKDILRLLARIQKQGPLTEPYSLPIGSFFPPINTIDDKVILNYKKQDENPEDPSYIYGVQPGDFIMEYIFPKKGRNGRGLDGAPIVVPEPTIKYAGVMKIDDACIRSTQDERGISYFSLVSGFIKREKGIFVVSQDLYLESVNMKTGSVVPGWEKDITLTVEQKNAGEDAVGAGLRIDIKTVDISGTVGENTKIKACDLSIDAQTHKKSTIDVSGVANIKLHRGDLKAKEANIEVLEGGTIEGDIVRIKKMLGGEVIARKVYIETLFAHGKIIALESIEVDNIEGEGNTMSIDPAHFSVYHEQIAEATAKIFDKENTLREDKKQLGMKQFAFKEKNVQMKRFQQRIADAKNSGREPLEMDVLSIKQYRAEAGKLQLLSAKVVEEENALHILRDILKTLHEADMHGVITHHGTYYGNNRVQFFDPDTRQEYSVFPKGNVEHIRLQKRGDEKALLLH
ncbi:MAG: FapA family protein [Sulfuricurvum sp.]|nr:FapA family protein [Sulfuricurvum sp.]MDP3119441.1 FapA family protein [Sulfuricurvum sp.]